MKIVTATFETTMGRMDSGIYPTRTPGHETVDLLLSILGGRGEEAKEVKIKSEDRRFIAKGPTRLIMILISLFMSRGYANLLSVE